MGFQTSRVENFHLNKGKEKQAAVTNAFECFKVKESQTTTERLEVMHTIKAIAPTITTRSIGLKQQITFHLYMNLLTFQKGYHLSTLLHWIISCRSKSIVVNLVLTVITMNEEDYAPLSLRPDFVVAANLCIYFQISYQHC